MGLGMQRLGLFLVGMLMWMGLPGCSGGGDSPQTGSPLPGGGGPVPQVEIKDVGTFNLAAGAKTGQISVDVPAGTASVMFIADGGKTTADIDIEDVINPTGNLIVGRRKPFVDPAGKNQLHIANDTLASGIFWNTRGPSITAGAYKFHVASYKAPATVQVHAIINRRENPTGGTLDVNLIFCGAPGLNKDNALVDPNFQVMFNEFKRLYAQANIQVKVAGTFNCNQASEAELMTIDNEDEFGDLLAQSSMSGNRAMNFFFVKSFGPLYGLRLEDRPIGRTSKIEGPVLLQGTRYSGVVTTTLGAALSSLTKNDLLQQGATMAHEGGHYLGLYHTTEKCGAGGSDCPSSLDLNENGQFDSWELVDPIQDTPTCPSSRRFLSPPDFSTVSAEGCRDLDGQNLMFWQAPPPGIVQDQLTAEQKSVLHDNPYIH